MKALAKQGRVYTTRTGVMRVKYFLKDEGEYLIEDKLVGDVWDDIPDAMHLSESEKTSYPTQKPEALLERVIRASSKAGDIVLDCFSGPALPSPLPRSSADAGSASTQALWPYTRRR